MDLFFISSPAKIIDTILTLPFQSETKAASLMLDLHGHMATHYHSLGEDALALPDIEKYQFCVMRPNTRGIDNIDYHMAYKLSIEWSNS
jgi:hypothetical protein